MAFSPVTVYIGAFDVDWNTVVFGASWLRVKGFAKSGKEVYSLYLVEKILFARTSVAWNTYVEYFLDIYRTKNATDPRDKTYALLGLAGTSSPTNPLPEYS